MRPVRAHAVVTGRGLAAAGASITIALLYASFAYAHFAAFSGSRRLSLLALVAFESLFAVMYLLRRSASESSSSLRDCVVTIGGSFGSLLLRPAATVRDVPIGDVVALVAAAMCFWSLAALNRRIGLLPANRGICAAGPYRFVRHPLYASYTLGLVGYLISNGTVRNVVIVAVVTALQALRIVSEERLLSRDAEYRSYASRTRWRVAPYVF